MSIITFNHTSTLIPDTELHGDELHESLTRIGAALLTPLNNMNTKLTTEIQITTTLVASTSSCGFVYLYITHIGRGGTSQTTGLLDGDEHHTSHTQNIWLYEFLLM